MTPLEFLREEFENVKRALKETLRYDFVPERSERYYNECKNRLAEIERAISVLVASDTDKIAARIFELSQLASWISLIERSHLGEFSWPFAAEIDRLASALLFDTNMKGQHLDPIIHVIASGSGYRISYESQVPSASRGLRFVIVEFPRSLKHHVLLHTIFGHELCHAAIHASAAGGLVHVHVVPSLKGSGPFGDVRQLNQWLQDPSAPPEVKTALAHYTATYGHALQLTPDVLESWLVELMCDLFGLLLFGPGFLAAHRALLGPMHPMPYQLQPTHPPYAVRHRMLVASMRLSGWNVPVTTTSDAQLFDAESELIRYLIDDPFPPWATVFSDAGLTEAMNGMRRIFAMRLGSGFTRPAASELTTLVQRLCEGVPPHTSHIDFSGSPMLHSLEASQILYAGWAYWIGRQKLPVNLPLSFFQTNRLCDLALLQQGAIRLCLPASAP